MGRRLGEFLSPRSRPKVLSSDNLAIFVAQLVGENILHTSPSTSPSTSLRYKKTGTRTKNLSNIGKMMNSNITSHHQTLPTICRLEWVNFLLETCGAVCIYSIILKAATTPAPPPPHRQLQPLQQRATSVLRAPCPICTSPDTPS